MSDRATDLGNISGSVASDGGGQRFFDPRQSQSDVLETMHSSLDGRQSQIHTSMPGIIVSFDAAKMTATVRPALKGIRTKRDGKREEVQIAQLQDVPVFFPGGGGHTLTFPIKAGDECILLFQERSIDYWHQLGDAQRPSDFRMHDINDAVALVGLRSQPKVPQAGASGSQRGVSNTTTQLRSDDGKTYIELDGTGNKIKMKCTGTITLDAPDVVVTGTISCYAEVIAQSQTGGFVTLSKHINHQGGGQNNPPTPGH